MDQEQILAISRPSPALMKLYLIRSILSGPGIIFALPVYLLRYLTLNYHFDDKGISVRWGFFFRREVNLTYSRIQDIHLVSGLIQRWLGLADIMIQTASGNAEAEMKIEGLHEFENIRHFIYTRMRGYADLNQSTESPRVASPSSSAGTEAKLLLGEIRDELKAIRAAVTTSHASPGKE